MEAEVRGEWRVLHEHPLGSWLLDAIGISTYDCCLFPQPAPLTRSGVFAFLGLGGLGGLGGMGGMGWDLNVHYHSLALAGAVDASSRQTIGCTVVHELAEAATSQA